MALYPGQGNPMGIETNGDSWAAGGIRFQLRAVRQRPQDPTPPGAMHERPSVGILAPLVPPFPDKILPEPALGPMGP